MNPKNSKGKVKRGLRRSFSFQTWGFPLVESSNLHGGKGGGRRGKGSLSRYGGGLTPGEMIEEREGGGKKWIPFTVAPRVAPERHRSDRWGAPIRLVTPRVQPVSPYRKYRLGVGKTEDLGNSNIEAISVEPTWPRKFRSFSSILRFCSLNLLEIFYETLFFQLSLRKRKLWLKVATGQTGGQHRSDRCPPEAQLQQILVPSSFSKIG
jgi:hypothetical protein